MKYYIKVWYSLCLLIGLLASCNEDGNLVPTGTLYLNVEEDQTLQTRATSEVTYESLQVAILQGEEDTLKVYNDYLTEVKGQRLVLPVGKYTVAVRSNGADGVAWETPLYQGSEEVEVKQGEITNTKVTCTIANTKVSVVYADDLNEYFTDYQTTVSTPSGALLYTRDEYRAGFFTPEKLTVLLKLVNNDGNEFVIKKVYPDIEPQYHYTFKFTVSNDNTDDEAGADVDVDVDKEHQEITYDIFIKEEELTNIGEPSAKLGGAFTDGVYTFKRTEQNQNPASNTISLDYILGSKNTLQSFVVTMDSPTGVSRFDITKGEGSQIGFPILPNESVDASDPRYNTYRIDLSGIVQYLKCLNEQPTEYTFKVDILDDKYQETSMTFVIKMMPDVAAYIMEPYCWSTFAVLRGNGGSDGSSYFVLTTPDGEKEIKEKIKRDADGNISVLVIGLKAGSYSYKMLSVNDPTIQTKDAAFTISDPTSGSYTVPNLGFEEWGTITENKLAFTFGKNYISPNSTNDFNQVYWESGNYGATGGSKVLAQGISDVVSEPDLGSQKAAKLTSQFAGLGSIGAFSAGSVFIGKPTSVSSDGAKLLYGRPYIGFPTHLSGYYKYTPGNIDYILNDNKGNGQTDQAIIYIALSTKQFALESLRGNPSGAVRFKSDDKSIFAYGELVEAKKVEKYTSFDIKLTYRNGKMPSFLDLVDANGVPKIYITIVATCSKDGDQFTGSTSSELYIDEFSLNYDYDAASFVGTEFEGMEPVIINNN